MITSAVAIAPPIAQRRSIVIVAGGPFALATAPPSTTSDIWFLSCAFELTEPVHRPRVNAAEEESKRTVRARRQFAVKLAKAFFAASIVTWQVPTPVHAPLQPEKKDPSLAVGVRVTVVPAV